MNRVKRQLAPYFLVLPGGLWLLLFFAIPMIAMLSLSLQQGDVVYGYQQTFHWQNYTDAIDGYHTQLIRSLIYAAVGTILLIALAFPVAYWIAFYGGRRKPTYLFLLLLPFFVSFVIRTLAWEFILSDQGIVLGTLKNLHLLPENFHVLATGVAVIAGIAYNYLPFTALPLYVALERMDPRVLEAAGDLYASKRTSFVRVTLPLAIPGIFAAFLLTFVPAVGDFVNAQILGGTSNTMIGTVIQTEYLVNNNYPTASALSTILLVIMLVGIFLYGKLLGSRTIEEYI